MVFGVVPEPRHVDELEGFYRQHRLLGVGIVIGGVVALVGYVVALLLLDVDVRTALLLCAAWLLPLAFGWVYHAVGAAVMERRIAARMRE